MNLFFDRRKLGAKPPRLCLHIGPRQPLSRPLDREAELVEQARNMVVVVPDAEPLIDQIRDHRPGPHAGAVSSHQRTVFNHLGQLGPLLFGQKWRTTWCFPSPQAGSPFHLIPSEPPVDGTPSHREFPSQRDHRPAGDVSANRAASPPLVEVVPPPCVGDKLVQRCQLTPGPPTGADRFSCFRTCHDLRPGRSAHDDPLPI